MKERVVLGGPRQPQWAPYDSEAQWRIANPRKNGGPRYQSRTDRPEKPQLPSKSDASWLN